MKLRPNFAPLVVAAISYAALGCGSSSSGGTVLSPGGNGDASLGGDVAYDPDSQGLQGVDAGTSNAADISAEAFFVNDPPPATCGDAGVTPVAPGGTVDCPDDKNLEGCPCPTEGQSAACWPGYRKNRNRGQCKDGTTTCVKNGEIGLAWGPCNGYVLPDPAATAGAAACLCFSGGTWAIANLEPCFYGASTSSPTGAVSTIPTYDSSGSVTAITCPSPGSGGGVTAPSTPWSHTTLKTDCAGHFRLCYTLKAGDSKNPQPTDCTITSVCAEGDYTTANVVQPWPDLPSWVAPDSASSCIQQFNATGGYGEMSVVGTSVECNGVNKVFNRVGYCSSACTQNPSAPGCVGCSSGGSGSF